MKLTKKPKSRTIVNLPGSKHSKTQRDLFLSASNSRWAYSGSNPIPIRSMWVFAAVCCPIRQSLVPWCCVWFGMNWNPQMAVHIEFSFRSIPQACGRCGGEEFTCMYIRENIFCVAFSIYCCYCTAEYSWIVSRYGKLMNWIAWQFLIDNNQSNPKVKSGLRSSYYQKAVTQFITYTTILLLLLEDNLRKKRKKKLNEMRR